MIESFGNAIAREIWSNNYSRKLPQELHERAKALLTIMFNTSSLEELKVRRPPPAVRFHKPKGKHEGRWAIDVDKSSGWRITFDFKEGKFFGVKIEDYH